jgi:polysaccharide export outer membrane protein
MKPLSCALLSILLLLPYNSGRAQQPGSKPVLSAAPAPPPAAPPASPAASPGTGAGAMAVDPTYIIGPEDSLQINVWKEPNFSASLPVTPDGMITIPLVGDVPAAGRTRAQLTADLTERLKKFITDPTVTVSVLAVNSKRVYFYGEVGHAGPLTLTPAMTILQAIDTAGGLTPYANKKKIYIMRGEQGKKQKILFDYKKAIKSGDSITLLPGDEIFVP